MIFALQDWLWNSYDCRVKVSFAVNTAARIGVSSDDGSEATHASYSAELLLLFH